MNIFFRTDASLQIGTGHVMRCLTLAQALRQRGAECRFVCREHEGNLLNRIENCGFDVCVLPFSIDAEANKLSSEALPTHSGWLGTDWQVDARQTIDALGGETVDVLIVDHYGLDWRWEQALRDHANIITVIDDLADRRHIADVLLDQNLGRETSDYDDLVSSDCIMMVGPRFALLRQEFAALRAEVLAMRNTRNAQDVLITMGGVDAADVSTRVLRILSAAPLPENLRFIVVMGSTAPALASVRSLVATMPFHAEVIVDPADMATLMARADIAIGAAGSTVWERCCLGLPSLMVQVADNQAGIAEAVADAYAAIDVGSFDSPTFSSRLLASLNIALKQEELVKMSEAAASVCDGDGAGRVIATLIPTDPCFRDADRSDSRRVWEWRRAGLQSFRLNNNETEFAEHDSWFVRALRDPHMYIRILMWDMLPCGYLRLDICGDASARISLCLSLDFQGKGLGHKILVEAERLGRELALSRLEAVVHHENLASVRIFESAGYESQMTSDAGFHRYFLSLDRLQ